MEVIMPQLGETVAEGKISVWYKSVGDKIEPGDNLFEIETEKVSMEVPAVSAGVLSEIRVAVGESAEVGAIVAIISDGTPLKTTDGEARTTKPAQPSAPPQTVTATRAPVPPSATRPSRPLDPFREVATPERNYGPARLASGAAVTPYARKLASDRKVDLASVKGSGPEGRIVGQDILDFKPADAAAAEVKSQYDASFYTETKVDGMRAAIARRLTESKRTVPHFQLTMDLEIDRLQQLRESLNAASQAQSKEPGRKISLNDLLIQGWAAALAKIPDANVVWAENKILRFSRIDIGLAVSIEGGLVTPVLRDLAGKSAADIGQMTKDLVARARSRKLSLNDLQGGVSTISNLGMYGVREFAAIINPPQSTILAVGASERRALEAPGGAVRFATCMSVTLGCDHRVVDGVLGAKLLGAFKEWVQQAR